MKLIKRKDWGARLRREFRTLPSARGVKIHYMGSPVNVALMNDHARCALLVRSVQNAHMDDNGWSDIAYNFLVCPHGEVFEGRGIYVESAANGPGLNKGHFAVAALLGNAGLTHPTNAMLHGLRDAIEFLREHGAGNEIRGHRDGYSTDCPGPVLYAWVREGAPRPPEDEVSAADVWNHPIDTGDGKAPWKAATVLGHLEKEQDTIKAELAAMRAEVAEIAALIRSGHPAASAPAAPVGRQDASSGSASG